MQLTKRNEDLENLLESLTDPVFVLDSDADLSYLNRAAKAFLTEQNLKTDSPLTATSYFNFLDELDSGSSEVLTKTIREVLKGNVRQAEGTLRVEEGLQELIITSLESGDDQFVSITHRMPNRNFQKDSGELKRSQLLTEVHQTTRELMEAENIEDVARVATGIASEYFDFATVGVRLLRDGKLRMIVDVKNDERLEGMPPAYEPGEGFVGRAFEHGEAVRYDDLAAVAKDIDFDYSPMRSAMLLPLGSFGIIGAASDEPRAFDPVDLELGKQFAADVESAMKRAEREEELRQREKELQRTTVNHQYLRNLMDTLPVGLFILDSQGQIKRTNRSLRTMLGYDKNELKDESGSALFEEGEGELNRIRETISGREGFWREETVLKTVDDGTVPVQLSADTLRNQRTNGRQLVLAAIDIRPRRKKSEQLYDSRRRLSLALSVAHAGVWEWNIKTDEVYWDKNIERIFGLGSDQFEVTYEDILHRVHPKDRGELLTKAAQAIEEKGELEKEFRIESNSHSDRWLMTRGKLFTDDEGNAETLLGVTMDITDRKKTHEALEHSIEEKETLLKEIHHRVKNNLQIINSFLSMQNRNIDSEKVDRAFRGSIQRVRVMAMVHEKLYQSTDLTNVDFEQYLRDLIENLVEITGVSEEVQLNINVKDYELDLDRGIACGLIVNELVTNALQHGLDGNEQALITIQFSSLSSDEYELQVRDNGTGFPDDFDSKSSRSTGLDIVHSLVEYELDGDLTFDNENGARVNVTF